MADEVRYRRLAAAKALALAGNYSAAYSVLDALQRKYPQDVEVHRLYGNILELDAFAFELISPMDERLRSARSHYLSILRISNYDKQAMFDLAEHFANINKKRVAKCFFEKFLAFYESEGSEEVERAKEWLGDAL
jgi:hypothetical protein